jgi:MoaA/NifB/PqqE/SkfB family radical SAM enzyme
MGKANFYSCKFYVTYQCNSQCIYCNFWSDEKYKNVSEMSLEEARYMVEQLKEVGVRYIDFTGGEPILYKHMGELLKYTKSLGIIIEYTTNAIAFAKYIEDIIPYVDNFNVSLDTLQREHYVHNRGVDTIDRTISLIKHLRTENKSAKIIAVITTETLPEINDLVKFAQENRTPIYLSPLFKYFDVDENGSDQVVAKELENIFYEPFSIINMHFIKFFERHHTMEELECSASQKILTIAPDGKVVVPCIYNDKSYISGQSRLNDTLQSEEFQLLQSQAGKMPECKGCTAIPYLGMSFSYHFNKIFLFQAFTEEYLKFKERFLDRHFPKVRPNTQKLIQEYRELERIIEEELPEIKPSKLFYKAEKNGERFIFKLWKYPNSFAEFIYDSLHEYCWDIEYSPHVVVKYFYNEIIPILSEFYRLNQISDNDYISVLNDIPLFQLNWWKLFVGRYFMTKNPVDVLTFSQRVAAFFKQIIEILPENAQSERIHELLFVASIMAGITPFRRKNPHFFNEETLAMKFLLLNRERYHWKDCHDWFSQRIQVVFENIITQKNEVAIMRTPIRRNVVTSLLDDEFLRKIPYDRECFYQLMEASTLLSEGQAEELIILLKEVLSLKETLILKDLLKEYQYFIRPDLISQKVAL